MIYSKNVRRMKSEKAEELLYRRECGYPYSGYLTTQGAEEVADLAEQEAEVRMRAKAVKAFDDMWFSGMEPDYEYHRGNFIKKLNEE